MRTLILAVSATAMAVPATLALPIDSAEAQRRYYNRDGYYTGPTWRGNDGRYYCRRSDGTTGLIVGGALGGTLGAVIAPGGSEILGALIGGAAGAAIGQQVDRGEVRCE